MILLYISHNSLPPRTRNNRLFNEFVIAFRVLNVKFHILCSVTMDIEQNGKKIARNSSP